MIRNLMLHAISAVFVLTAAVAMPSDARADTASDIAAILADTSLTVEEIATQVAALVTGSDDPSAAAAVILAAADGATASQLEGVGIGLGRAVLALQATDVTEASEVALEVAGASTEIQTAFEATTGSTASVLAGGGTTDVLQNRGDNQSTD